MSGRNVHKTDAKIFKLPQDAIQEDRGLKSCGTPQLVLASLTDVAPYKNDRTLIGAYKFDSMFVELEDANGVLTDAPGIEVLLPHQSDAVAWIIDWRQVVNGLGALAQGCYKVRVNWTKAGNSGWFYKGSYQLLEYTIENAAGTVRLYVVLNDFVRNQGINYKDSGAAGTVRFNGSFGYMQPNYETENNTLTDRTRHKVRIEALRSYELRTDYLHHCMTRLIDEETLLVANQIYISDHNAANHVQYYDFPVILSEDESPSFDYPQGSVFAKITAKFLDKKAWYESKYDGNIQGSTNMILQLPTTVASCAAGAVTLDGEPLVSVPSGTTVDVELVDQNGDTITPTSIVGGVIEVDMTPPPVITAAPLVQTGQTISYVQYDDGTFEAGRSFSTLNLNNPFGNTNRFTDTLGGQTYANNVVIDWSTFDIQQGKVLGYTKNYYGVIADWATCVANAHSTSLGTFTTGWRLTNINELQNLFNYSLTPSVLNYAPFTFPNTINLTTSTTYAVGTSDVYISQLNSGVIATQDKTAGSWYIACRDFTVTGTTLS